MTILEMLKRYSRDCINGKIESCEKHKNACQRFLNDCSKIKKKDYPYYWDEESAASIVKWFALLYHSKGELAGQPINLTEWQQFHLCQLYGWKRKEDGRRRFRKMFLQVARKNAKSQELAGISLYEASVTSTRNKEVGEIYTAGTKREQSKIVFEECRLMLKNSPLIRKFKLTNSMIQHIKSGSFIRALSKDDGKNGDGSNPAVLVLDEYHQHPDTKFYDLFIGSNTKEPILVIITTAGIDLNVPCYREYQYCASVIDPTADVVDEEYLIDICEQDAEDYEDPRNLQNEKIWLKSNPIRATYPEGLEKIRMTYEKARKVPEDMPACLTKNFNIWLQARENGYMDMKKWKMCEVKKIPVDIRGMSCVVGVDLSTKTDLCAVCIVIPYKSETETDAEGQPVTKYIVTQHSFIPNREKLLEHETVDKMPFTAWEQMGLLTVTDTQIVDQKAVMMWVLDYVREHGLRIDCWAVDPYNASLFMTTLDERGEKVWEVYQSYSGLNDATVAMREEVYQGNILYEPDPLLNFAMRNAVVRYSDGRIKIDKDRAKNRIDPVDAMICGFKYAQLMEQNGQAQSQLEQAMDAWLNADW